jgi:metal-responsive CopG/Arc/MetJ family transcriptional regulator
MATSKTMRKITISLPAELVDFADDHAKVLHTSRSQVIGMALTAVKNQSEAELAADGYRFYAQEASDFAAASANVVAEVWGDSISEDEGVRDGGQAG